METAAEIALHETVDLIPTTMFMLKYLALELQATSSSSQEKYSHVSSWQLLVLYLFTDLALYSRNSYLNSRLK